ncbi:MAG: hypothetical protein FJ387_27560 [Verrucomicrobia bacterium]|nr:hypothetical protein [Verrucomicrobiota bacterium]
MNAQSQLHQILLQPTDVLFFRDGRPMSGSLAGHTAAWPLPDATNHALHAALHRAQLEARTGEKLHTHRRGRSGHYSNEEAHRDRKFGALLTAGPFPVHLAGANRLSATPTDVPADTRWFFPRPRDAQLAGSVQATLQPVRSLAKNGDQAPWPGSSLPAPLVYAVANTQPPEKEAGGEPWISTEAFDDYLRGNSFEPKPDDHAPHFLRDTDLADLEHSIGIGIDPATQTQDQTNFYVAHYLRLRERFRLGLFAEAMDKLDGERNHKRDLLAALLEGPPQTIVVGGQQRVCTASRTDAPGRLPLPKGLGAAADFIDPLPNGRFAVKWVLLSPAVWPQIQPLKKDGSPQNPHPGGWLPNWVYLDWDVEKRAARPNDRNGEVLLTVGPGVRKAQRRGGEPGSRIGARLVAAIVPKPIVVTGWALGDPGAPSDIEDQKAEIRSGAKSTHLAVPAGAVYYFEAGSSEAAAALANALNWHGSTGGSEIKNRRSTLLGEKGYGLGVCGTWRFYGES